MGGKLNNKELSLSFCFHLLQLFDCFRYISFLKVDLKCVKPTAGGHYYKHHLPMLGEKSEVIAASAMTARPSTMIVGAAAPNFPMEVFPQGAASNVEAVATKSISYSNEKRSIDASELSSLNELGEKSHKSFEANDRVRISTQKDIFMTLQSGHGGWNSTMADVGILILQEPLLYVNLKEIPRLLKGQ